MMQQAERDQRQTEDYPRDVHPLTARLYGARELSLEVYGDVAEVDAQAAG